MDMQRQRQKMKDAAPKGRRPGTNDRGDVVHPAAWRRGVDKSPPTQEASAWTTGLSPFGGGVVGPYGTRYSAQWDCALVPPGPLYLVYNYSEKRKR